MSHIVTGYFPYTYEEVTGDTDPENFLPLNAPGVAIVVEQNPAIAGYVVTDATTGKLLARAQRSPSGSFTRTVFNDAGTSDSELNPPTDVKFSGKLPFRLTASVEPGDKLALTILYNNGNSYGNIITRQSERPAPELRNCFLGYRGEQPNGDGNYASILQWTPTSLQMAPWPAMSETYTHMMCWVIPSGAKSQEMTLSPNLLSFGPLLPTLSECLLKTAYTSLASIRPQQRIP